ncbi:PREDICTED: gamma-butyrobetaine dioxygenase-like [Branchiostoma belcheri]|uniref:Gamma-butyrobetaine dioxygenase-like n=1 Tax=Branchiostoma belcheri TaxID=7741 RepID=A0A6P4YRT6_BRABE|nr:PREDICTED: gamma-butyrobetaine dioxygenase-like [Branchiostoma belcheri]
MERAKLDRSSETVEVEWSAGGVDWFPYVWLRDNCQCSECFQVDLNKRLVLTSRLDLDVAPDHANVQDRGSTLHVTWPDGHRSQYDWQWLRDRCFSPQARADRETRWRRKKQLWGAELFTNLPTADFPALLSDDRALYDFLFLLDTIGLVLVQNVPRQPGQFLQLANRVAFPKMTFLGSCPEVPLFIAQQVQMMHCIKQTESEGGASELVDAFNAAYQLKQENPDAFKLLTTVKVNFHRIGKAEPKHHMKERHHIISISDKGEVQKVVCGKHSRDSVLDVPLDQVKPFYRAMRAFDDILAHPRNCIRYKMKEGDILAFDNLRVLHDRTAFSLSGGERHLQVGYVDWDETYSRMRVLQAELGIQE